MGDNNGRQFNGADSLLLAIKLQLADTDAIYGGAKGKSAAHEPSDYDTAMADYRVQLQHALDLHKDMIMAQSIAHSVQTDSHAIAVFVQEEDQAKSDHSFALSQNGQTTPTQPPPSYEQAIDEGLVRTLASLELDRGESHYSDAEATVAGPSKVYSSSQQKILDTLTKRKSCIACGDTYFNHEILSMPCCSHHYCIPCLRKLFIKATRDEGLFPPRCCRINIPQGYISGYMTAEELESFELAEKEFSSTDRKYCSNTDCGRFIVEGNRKGGRACCDHCGQATCVHCHKPFHTGDCPEDFAQKSLMNMAENEGWRQCSRCHVLVELTVGCYHMTCHCKYQFCYLCGARWKTCSCPTADEGRLMMRVQEIADRRVLAGAARLDQQEMEDLRDRIIENHECEHPGRFRKIENGRRNRYICERCGAVHRKFILRCRRCELQVCQECRCNRI